MNQQTIEEFPNPLIPKFAIRILKLYLHPTIVCVKAAKKGMRAKNHIRIFLRSGSYSTLS